MPRISKTEAEFYIKCEKLFITELKRIRTRFEKNRVKELQELLKIDEEMENTSETEIMDGYGWGCFDEEEYDRRLREYHAYQEKKEQLKNMPTIQTQMIKIINACIAETQREINCLELDAMTDEETEEYYKRQTELEKKRKKRLKERGQ